MNYSLLLVSIRVKYVCYTLARLKSYRSTIYVLKFTQGQ